MPYKTPPAGTTAKPRKRSKPRAHTLEDYETPSGEVVKAWRDSHGTWRLPSGGYAPGSSGRLSGSQQAVLKRRAQLAASPATQQAVVSLLSSQRASWSAAHCKACSSPNRTTLERWRAKGDSYRRISAKLLERGESISDVALRRHLLHHIDVAGMVLERVAKDEQLTAAVDKETSDLDRLGGMIERLSRLEKELSGYISDSATAGKAPAMSVAHSYQTVVQGLRQAISLRDDLLGGQPQAARSPLKKFLTSKMP